MINQRVLMSSARYFGNEQAINPYYHQETVDVDEAVREHAAIRALYEQAGIRVECAEPPVTSQDGVYTANWALVRHGTAVLARLPAARQSEEPVARAALEALGLQVVQVPEGLRFSGQGDSLICGDLLFAGSGYRSDEAAQAFAAETLGLERVQLRTVPEQDAVGQPVTNAVSGWPDSFFYDLDLALAIIRGPENGAKGLIAYCPEAFMPESRAKLQSLATVDKVEVSLDEAQHGFACNLVSTGETVIMSGHAPKLRAELEERGLKVVSPVVKELVKGGGFIRCVSLTLE